ncbi:MerR family transcriptional regulator [Actinomadura sp. 6N118]|uniref:MerR family transcriptional regulator n=1 Tax=Actinomadura sp. 6N118 TaxID=3375151 RepID=UPI00379B9CC8
MRSREAGGQVRLRPVDLARIVGVSTQQIRNYADAGILPPTERTAAGYRRFETRHREAMLTYRVMAKGFGWDAARSIMQALHADGLPAALTIVDARHAGLHEQRLSLHAAAEALEAVAGQTSEMPGPPSSAMRIGEVAAYLGVRTSALRVWESAGLLMPQREAGTGYRRYGAADVRDARMVNMLRQGRYPLPQIRAVLDGLRRTGSTAELRAAIAERHAALDRTSAAMLEGAARLHRYVTEDLSVTEDPRVTEDLPDPSGSA